MNLVLCLNVLARNKDLSHIAQVLGRLRGIPTVWQLPKVKMLVPAREPYATPENVAYIRHDVLLINFTHVLDAMNSSSGKIA
jgi:hypothetical protein